MFAAIKAKHKEGEAYRAVSIQQYNLHCKDLPSLAPAVIIDVQEGLFDHEHRLQHGTWFNHVFDRDATAGKVSQIASDIKVHFVVDGEAVLSQEELWYGDHRDACEL